VALNVWSIEMSIFSLLIWENNLTFSILSIRSNSRTVEIELLDRGYWISLSLVDSQDSRNEDLEGVLSDISNHFRIEGFKHARTHTHTHTHTPTHTSWFVVVIFWCFNFKFELLFFLSHHSFLLPWINYFSRFRFRSFALQFFIYRVFHGFGLF